MTLTIRHITRRSDGTDIVRTRRIEGDQAIVGRAEDCDIVLPDLALLPRHARLTLIAGGKVRIEGLERAKVRRADIDPAAGGAVDLGDHRLAFEPGAQAGEVTVTVSRTRAATGGVAEPTGVFSIRAGLFGKRRLAWVLALAVLIVTLAWPIASFHGGKTIFAQPDAQWSVGHLSQAHAFLEDSCQSCHEQAFVAVRDETCMTCHAAARDEAVLARVSGEVKAQGSLTAPLFIREHADHTRLMSAASPPKDGWERFKARVGLKFGRTGDRCVACHFEHEGPAGFKRTALADLPAHPALRETDTCSSCHSALKRRLTDTLLIDTPDWPRHPDFKSWTGARPQVRNLKFSHVQHLDGAGAVARAATGLSRYGGALQCADCHRQGETSTFEPVRMERDCGGCHDLSIGDAGGRRRLPHGDPGGVIAAIQGYFGQVAAAPLPADPRRRPGLAPEAERTVLLTAGRESGPARAAAAIRSVFADGGLCHDCHLVTPRAGAAPLIARVDLADHFLTRGGFDHRTPGHRPADPGGPPCATCHAASSSRDTADILMPHMSACATCHGKPREPSLPAASGDCVGCHSFHAPMTPVRKPDGDEQATAGGTSGSAARLRLPGEGASPF